MPTDAPTPTRPPEAQPRKSASPVFWMVMLVIALLLIWWAYTRFASQSTPAPTQPVNSGAVRIGSESDQREAGAQAERDQADAAAQQPQQP